MSMGSSCKDKVMAPLIVFLGCAFLWVLGAIVAICDGSPSPKKLDKWFHKAPNHLRERATGIYRGRYNPTNDYEEFHYVTLIKWYTMSPRDRLLGYEKATKKSSKSQYTPVRRNEFNSYGSE